MILADNRCHFALNGDSGFGSRSLGDDLGDRQFPENPFSLDTLSSWMDNQMIDWRDWELVCEVFEHGGVTAAARRLGQRKSSLSAAVQRLEGNLGLRLI